MKVTRRLRAVLLACAASNAAVAAVGIATFPDLSAKIATASAPAARAVTDDAPTTTVAPEASPTTAAPAPTTAAPTQTTSSRRARAQSPTTTPAVAADDVTGIASSAAPPDPARIAPNAGRYPASFAGSASVAGRKQTVPANGDIVLSGSGTSLSQSSPDAPGGVVLDERFSAEGVALAAFQMSAGDETKRFQPGSPVMFLRFNAPAGTTWQWAADSTDGKTHLKVTGTVGAHRTIHVNGEAVATIEIRTDITISGDINGTAQLTTWVSPKHRLPVQQRQVINASARGPLGFSQKLTSDLTTTLTSLTPR